MATMRINRALALAGVASRRGAEELVRAGRVSLNGAVVQDLSTQVNIGKDMLALDGKPLKLIQKLSYYAYFKPRGIVSTLKDELGRPALDEVCSALPGRPKPVGRLDRSSEGLLILSSDGELANRLTHPRYGVRKEYQVTVSPKLADADAQRATSGVELEDGPARFEGIELVGDEHDRSRLRVVVTEGRNRLIRRLFEALGYETLRLKRVRMGAVALGKLEPGQTRALSADEVMQLKKLVKM
jgi:23S rRNA pseudouridine2605 synthase